MTSTAQDRTTAISPMVRTVRRHARLALVVGLALFVVTAVAVLAYPVKSEATATVQLYPVAGGPTTTSPVPVNVSTEARAGSSEVVLTQASALLGGSPDAAELSRQLEVDAPDGSQNLMFTVQSSSGEASAERANAVARAYLAHSKERAAGIVKAGTDRLSALINKAKADPNLSKDVAQLELALAEQQQLNVEPGQLVDPAQASKRSWLPTVIVALFAGLALGLIAGIAVALLRDRLAKNAIDAGRLAAVTGHAVLSWDGGQEGVRRLMDRMARTRPGVSATILTGDAAAARQLLQAMSQVETERQRQPDAAVIDAPTSIDTGRAAEELLAASESTPLLRLVAPELGISRFVRLSDAAVPVLVADAKTPLADFLEAVDQIAATRHGVEIVFAEKFAPRAVAQTPASQTPVASQTSVATAQAPTGAPAEPAETQPAAAEGESQEPSREPRHAEPEPVTRASKRRSARARKSDGDPSMAQRQLENAHTASGEAVPATADDAHAQDSTRAVQPDGNRGVAR